MSGFLDPKERVIDMILTETGKQLLMKGELRFVYWIPFDDEVDYNPPNVTQDPGHLQQTVQERTQELVETPLVRECSMGYRGLNLVSEDLTNVHRPMFTAVPGVGLSTPLPQMTLDVTGVAVSMEQAKLTKTYVQKDSQGKTIVGQVGPVTTGFQRSNASTQVVNASYSTGAFTDDSRYEGFLITVYQSSSLVSSSIGTGTLSDVYLISGQGGHQEILHNRDSQGNIVYSNDLALGVKSS